MNNNLKNLKSTLKNRIQNDYFKENRGLDTRDIRFGFEAGFEAGFIAAWEYINNNKHVVVDTEPARLPPDF